MDTKFCPEHLMVSIYPVARVNACTFAARLRKPVELYGLPPFTQAVDTLFLRYCLVNPWAGCLKYVRFQLSLSDVLLIHPVILQWPVSTSRLRIVDGHMTPAVVICSTQASVVPASSNPADRPMQAPSLL